MQLYITIYIYTYNIYTKFSLMSPSFSALLGELRPSARKAMGGVNTTWRPGPKKDGLSEHIKQSMEHEASNILWMEKILHDLGWLKP